MSRSHKRTKKKIPGDGCWLCDYKSRALKWKRLKEAIDNIRVSSNGRITDSESDNWGSSPYTRSILEEEPIKELCPLCKSPKTLEQVSCPDDWNECEVLHQDWICKICSDKVN